MNSSWKQRARMLSAALAISSAALFLPASAQAQEVELCDQASLEAAVADGGSYTFSCDGIILLTNTLDVRVSLVLDAAGHNVTIASPGGTNGVRLFNVITELEEDQDPQDVEPVVFEVRNLKFFNGVSTNGGGAIFVDSNSVLLATSCIFSNNVAIGFDGVAGNNAHTNSDESNGGDGRAGSAATSAAGGAVFNLGFSSFTLCTFLTNSAIGGVGGNGGSGGPGTVAGGDGAAAGKGGAAWGGAIYNAKLLYVTQSTFNENLAVGGSGGLGGTGGSGRFGGFAGDSGHGGGGGAGAGAAIFSHRYSSNGLDGCTFALNGCASGDTAEAESGGGVSRNGGKGPDASGGALANLGTNFMINCTFFANAAIGGSGGNGGANSFHGGKGGAGGTAWGGNVFNGGKTAKLYANSCTFSDGSAIGGTNGAGGDAPLAGDPGKRGSSRGSNLSTSNGVVLISNCILAYPAVGTNGYGKIKDGGANMSSDKSVSLDKHLPKANRKVSVDPRLDVLRDNGGPVETLKLLDGSPAIDKGSALLAPNADARGVARPLGANADIGAYESGLQLTAPTIVTSPLDQFVQPLGTVVFQVVATGDPPLRYQWRHASTTTNTPPIDIDDATNSTYTVVEAGATDEGSYEVVVSNNSGATTSQSATLTVLELPEIVDDPSPVTVSLGYPFTLTVTAEGDDLRYRWLTNGVSIPGAVQPTYTVLFARLQDAGEYTVEVCNDVACVVSQPADVIVTTNAPAILMNPQDMAVQSNHTATLSVQANGSLPLSYYWRKGAATVFIDTNVFNQSSVFSIPNVRPANAGAYQVVVSNSYGQATSLVANVYVQTVGPSISVQPVGGTVVDGNSFTFSVTAAGDMPLGYQWFRNGAAVPGATSTTFVFTNVTPSDAATYTVRVMNAVNTVTSSNAVLVVQLVPPSIFQQPTGYSGYTGEDVTLSAVVHGSAPRSAWFLNNAAIPGATNTTLNLPNVQLTNNGNYFLVATNTAGMATSVVVSVSVASSAPVITAQLPSLASDAGTNQIVIFPLSVVGSKPLSYHWFFNGAPLFSGGYGIFLNLTNPASQTAFSITNTPAGSSLTVLGVKPADEGVYHVNPSNSVGVVVSDDALLDVLGFGIGN